MKLKYLSPGFRICQGKGFQITFDNLYTLSVQFGPGNYCDNRDKYPRYFEDFQQFEIDAGENGSPNAEIAVLNFEGKLILLDDKFPAKFRGDTVCGWLTSSDIVELIALVSAFPMADNIKEEEEYAISEGE